VDHVLSGPLAGVVGKAQERQRRPGHTTATAEARGIAARLAHGLLRPSVLPPPPIQALRDLTRTRVARVQSRRQAKNRVHTILEATKRKRARVIAARCGVSGRRRRAAFMAGARDPHRRAPVARGRWRRQLAALELALQGQFTTPHARLMALALEGMDRMHRQLAALEPQRGELIAPLYPQIEPRLSLPGVEATAARARRAAIGTDMTRLGADARLASGAGGCPGTHASAGKRRRGRTRQGHRDLRRVVVPCAWAARKTSTVIGRTCRRLDAR
jgi:transposase